MASGGREPNVFSSDEEDLHCVKKRTKRPKAIVTSDSDSDSDKDFDKRKRKNVRPLDLDSEESDNKYNETSFSNDTRVCSNSNEDSSLINDLSDNEQSEKCAICLGKFAGQDIATPEACDHMFCLECLHEWAKNVNTCPIDRLKFNLILVRHHKEDKICKRISVNSPDSPWLSDSDPETIFSPETALCASCGEPDDVSCLFTCQECEKAFHARCLSHPSFHLLSRSGICPSCEISVSVRGRRRALCASCGERDDVCRLFTCHECEKAFHARCLSNPSFHLLARSGICPSCEISFSVRRFRSDRLGAAYEFGSYSPNVNRLCYIEKRLPRLFQARMEQELAHMFGRRRQISSSESSDEDTELTGHNTQHRNRMSSRSQCPLIQKRRIYMSRNRNQSLISTTASATSNSELYSVDSDDENNEYRYDNRDHEQDHHDEPSSSSRSRFSCQPRTKIETASESENYDLVGSILQTQALILRPEAIKLQRDGTVLLNSDLSSNSRMNSSSSSGNEERLIELPSFSSSRPNIPHTDGVTYKQQPLNPTQNSNSKYRETDRENYTCTSSSTSKQPSIDCDNVSISSRNTFQNSGNERYNDNSCSSLTHKNFCSSSATEDIKKVSNFKESNKSHHSEDEVDIYSDIESVGDDEGVCSTLEGVGDRMEPMEMTYKGDQSPSSNPEAATDSSDNELVIDEDMAAEDESENRKENIQMNNRKDKCENEQVNESDESNVSYSGSFSEQQKNRTPDIQDSSSCVDSRSVEDGQLGEESSRETFQSSGGAGGYKADSECDSKYGSEYDESKNGSEYEENKNESECEENKNESECEENKNESECEENKNESECEENKNESECEENKNESECEGNKNESECEENKNESECEENKNSSEYGEEKNRSEDEDNNESVAEEIKNASEYDDQESDMDVQVYEDNSVDSSKKSPRAETSTPCSTISSPKQYDEEMKEQESLDQCDNSLSSGVQEFEDANSRKDSENVDVSLMQTNENTSGSFSQAEENENYQNENNSNLSFESSQNAMSEPEEAVDSENVDASQTFSERDKKELEEGQNEIKSAEYNDEKENEVNDVDFSENASTPCLDENIDSQIEDSPVHNDTIESTDPDFKSDATEYDSKLCRTPPSGSEYEMVENDEISLQKTEEQQENSVKTPDNAVDLGIEDISEAGSGDLDDDFADENASFSESKEQVYNDTERDPTSYEYNDVNNDPDSKVNSKHSDDTKYQNSSHSNQSFEEREEGEIIDEKPVRRPDRKRGAKFERYHDDNEDYGELPRVNISDLPRIPKIKRDKEKESVPEEIPVESKRTSVLGRVDLGGGDISWKRLSKHTRERSYRDGRPKEEKVLYRERESRKRDKKYSSDNEWRSDSKSSRRDDSKKDSEKLRSEYDSRTRKNDRKESKVSDWEYSDRDKRNKSHKDKHKDKHRDKKEKTKHDKNKHSKDDMKYSRDRSKDDDRYERELKLEKEQRFERVVHEKGKCKDKDHKSKHKDRKNDIKSGKDHSREKHKHIYISDHFSEKQREREVRKIDDKLKIVVEQKEGRKDKAKHKDKKESKHDKKQIHHHEHRKKEVERSPYTELTSIESKEIFAKGDSIIINVSFNRTNSPKDANIENTVSSFKDRKSEEFEVDDVTTSDKNKKHSLGDKGKCMLDTPATKRPVTPPERTNPVLSVSECYWQGGEDSDANSADSEKSVVEITNIEEENDTMESADPLEAENFSSSFNSNDATESQTIAKEAVSENEKTPEKIEKVDNSFAKESENLVPPKRRSPRSPSPPSPADNDSYDPCEPTRSPSPPPMPPAPPLPTGNPKPPPSPELPPLPPEPEPIDNIREETINHKPSEFSAVSSVVTNSQPVTVNTQTSVSNPISMPSMLLPPPSFMSHTSATTNSLPSLSSLLPPNFSFQVNNHPNVIFQSNHVQQVIRGIAPSQMHATSAIPPPPNPPSLPHMGSVPPPPPPPSAMALISQVRHPQMNVRPAMTPNQILQNLTMGHPVTMSQMQITHLHHLPPNLSNALNNHQSPMMIPSQSQSLNHSVSIQNQPVSRVVLSQNQMLNHSVALQNQNMINKPQGNALSHQSVSNITSQKSDKVTPEKTEVIDMDVDSPYSPGDSPSMDSVCDYSPTCSPLPSSPKNKDIFDSLLPTDHRTSDRKIQDVLGKAEKSKRSKNDNDTPNKRAKHEHKRHSVRMQLADKNKSKREQRIEKKLDDSQLKILDELPSSAVEMQVKEKFLKKLNRQERVVEEVKLVLKPYYKSRDVTKEEYKDILRKSVPKICHNKSGEINPVKVKSLVECYIKKIKHSRKKSDKKKSSKLS